MEDHLAWVWGAIGAPIVLAIIGAIGFLSKKVWSGASYYAEKLYGLTERLVDKHLNFVDTVSKEQSDQTKELKSLNTASADQNKILQTICENSVATASKIEKWDSDSNRICKIHEHIEIIVDRFINAAREQGLVVSREHAETVILKAVKKQAGCDSDED